MVVKRNVTEAYFLNLMKRARKRFELKSKDNPNGFIWPNAHRHVFHVGGIEFRLEWMADLDMDFLRH